MMKKLAKYFLNGLLIFVPLILTVVVIAWAFTWLDSSLRTLFDIKIPGLGLGITILMITFIGFTASNFIGRKLFSMIDTVFNRVPLVKLLYSSIKDFINAFAGNKKSFDKPVIVELTPNGPKALGFITRKNLEILGMDDHVAVYFPQSYNFAGSVLIFKTEQVKPLDMEPSNAMAFIVSGGVAGNKLEAKQLKD